MAIKFSDITGGGIPFGNNSSRPANPGIGKLYSNGEEKRLELYTSSGWQNIVSETPGVVSVSTTLGAVGAATINITGTNFTTGAIASVIGSNGVEVQASSTTVNSIVSVTASFTGLSYLNDPYDVKVTNTSNLFGLLPDAVNVNQSLIWQTAAGSLGAFPEQSSITLSAVSATDPESATVTYSLASGSSLPSGVTLNGSTGVISGTLPDVATNTTYTFTVNATDGVNIVPRGFSITSNILVAPTVEYLVVAGGGGGGADGGYGSGGGAGGFRTGSIALAASTTYTITVGNGGAGQSGSGTDNSGFGQDSVFNTITSTGGGRGRGVSGGIVGLPGGSGGGGDRNPGGAGNTPATNPSQGNAGGGMASGNDTTGGGGGAGGAGGNGTTGQGGVGGAGAASSITGVSLFYAAGGGGASSTSGGNGGSGIGGNAGNSGLPGSAGATNTGSGGGGGGGGYPNGAAGGSGVVIIAYPNSNAYIPPTISNGLTYTLNTSTRSGYRVYRFTAGSGTITF